MKHLVAALPIVLALLLPSAALAQPGKSKAHATHVAHTHKAAKKTPKAPKAPKLQKAPPKGHGSKKSAAK